MNEVFLIRKIELQRESNIERSDWLECLNQLRRELVFDTQYIIIFIYKTLRLDILGIIYRICFNIENIYNRIYRIIYV